jgi:hypothetical protein
VFGGGDLGPDPLEADDEVHPRSLDGCLALQLQPEFDEERDGCREVVDNDADVVHPLDRHGAKCKNPVDSKPRRWG